MRLPDKGAHSGIGARSPAIGPAIVAYYLRVLTLIALAIVVLLPLFP